ncbi:hypothetical protein FRB99_001550, partial [Tulasnella sp. 403]
MGFKDVIRKSSSRAVKGIRRSEAVAALHQVVRLVDAAQLPFCSTATGILVEIINMLEAVDENRSTSDEILHKIGDYAAVLNEFIAGMGPDYLAQSADQRAIIARESVADFISHLVRVRNKLTVLNRQSWQFQFWFGVHIKDELQALCDELNTAHISFKDRLANLVASDTRKANEGDHQPRPKLTIAGAKHLTPHDLFVVPMPGPSGGGSWSNIAIAKYSGTSKVVKLYPPRAGGYAAFLRDLLDLDRNISCNVPSIFGYCDSSEVPYIVLRTSRVMPFREYVIKEGISATAQTVVNLWKMLIDIRTALDFLRSNWLEDDSPVSYMSVSDCLNSIAVDDRGRALLPPLPRPSPGIRFPPCDGSISVISERYKVFFVHPRIPKLHALGYALAGNGAGVFDTDIRTFKDHGLLMHALRNWRPAPDARTLWWQATGFPRTSAFLPGDIGVADYRPGASVTFKKLGNIAKELGGLSLFQKSSSHPNRTQVSPNVFRSVFQPNNNYVCCGWSLRVSHWNNRWEYLAQHATRLGAKYGVPPEDLILVTESTSSARLHDLDKLGSCLTSPLYWYTHILIEDGSYSHSYWSPLPYPDETAAINIQDEYGISLPDVITFDVAPL